MQVDGAPARIAVLAGEDSASVTAVLRELPVTGRLSLIVVCPDLAAATVQLGSPWSVIEVDGRARLDPDRMYLVASERSAAVEGEELVVERGGSAIHAPLDCLLRSIAGSFGPSSIAVVLAGRGADGAIGLKLLKEAGGFTIVEQPGAPLADVDSERRQAAVATGMVDLVLPLPGIASRVGSIARGTAAKPITSEDSTANDHPSSESDALSDVVRDILGIVRARTGHDFALYKRATLYRRISRRMQVCQTEALEDYRRYLRDHPLEVSHLMRDLLISVTNFFRDGEAFGTLAETVIPRLFHTPDPRGPLRAWVAGCSTGEEVYSLGMLLAEHAARIGDARAIQLFATDIDENALAEARQGRYPETIASDVSPDRLSRFFTREPGHYRIRKELRERVLFSPHNLLRDPPFSRIDLVTCRNVLIYLNREAQDRVLNMFHFGLRPEGFLFLGSSEAAETTSNQFASLAGKHQIYQRRSIPSGSLGVEVLATHRRWTPPPLPPTASPPIDTARTFGELHHRLVEHYAPPSVLVNADLEVVHLSEHAGRYLQHAGGEPSRQLFQVVQPQLRTELRAAIYAARQATTGTEIRTVRFDDRGEARVIELRVHALDTEAAGRSILIMFEDVAPEQARVIQTTDTSMEPVVRQLEDELHRTRDQLRTTIEQYETSLEEVKASNEELQAINEELRSASEELETSKEELQSVNEELTTVNHELKSKVDEVSHTNSDLQNLMTSTDIAVLFLDRGLAVKRYTPRARDLYNLIPTDIGRPLAHVTHRLDCQDLPELADAVLAQLRPITREVTRSDGRRYLARLVPYRSLDDRIGGVVMTFADITELKDAVAARERSEEALHVTSERLQLALRGAPMAIVMLDETGAPVWSYARGVELGTETAQVMSLFAPDHAERFSSIISQVQRTGTAARPELDLIIEGKRQTYDFWIARSESGTTAVGFDITPSKLAETTLLDADRRKDEFLATLSHELRNPLTPLKVALEVAKLSENNPALQRKSREIIERQADQLTQLVDDLLDLSRITQGKLALDRTVIDPVVIVEAALAAMQPEIKAHGHELHVTLPRHQCWIFGDQSRLVQVLSNLLGNAIKYTPEHGQITLEVEADRARGLLAVRVRDNGVGIEAEVLRSIFDLFVQSRDSLGRSAGGLGFRLNLVRKLVELHDGTVSASSAGPGQGSELMFELPLVKEAS
ncbi:MAG: CheR family methyltransferase [Kofleriaceae bacterium]